MVSSSRLSFVLLLTAVLGIPHASSHGDTLYWSGNGTTQGGNGTWDQSLPRWGTVYSGPYSVVWNNANNDTAVYGSTAGSVTLGGNIAVGGLQFGTTGYSISTGANTLSFNATNNFIGFSGSSAGTISGSVGGSGNVATRLVNPLVGTTLTNFALTLNGTSTGGWSGSTTVGTLSTFALAESNQALLNTSGITLNGGGITLTNINGTEGALDRISNTAPITSNGGTLRLTNTVGSGIVYGEAIGNVTHNSGQLNLVLTTNQNGGGGNNQTLTVGNSGVGLVQSGSSNVVFASAGNLNTTTNIIRVNGITTSTPAGQIIGPWATVGTSAGLPTDFAKYTSDGTYGSVTAAAITGSSETSWTNSANAYTTNVATTTLTDNRTMMGLRLAVTNSVLELADFRLETNSLLHSAANGATVRATTGGATGYLTTPSGGGNLYLAGNTNALAISAAVKDNAGPVTIVKVGTNTGTTSLSGIVSVTGGVVVSGGSLSLGNASNTFSGGIFLSGGARLIATSDAMLGNATNSITFNGDGALAFNNNQTYARNVIVNNGAIASFVNSASQTISGNVTGSGGVAMNNSGAVQVNLSGTANTFEGPILIGSSGVTNQSYRFQFSSLTDNATANGRIVFAASSVTTADGSVFQYNGATGLNLNNRVIEIASTGATPTNGHQIRNNGSGNLTIATDLLVTSTTAQTLTLTGNNTGSVFSGKIGNGASSAVSLVKSDVGTWSLGGANSYTGSTTIIGGTLRVNGSLASGSAVTVLAGATLGGNGTIGGLATISGILSPGNSPGQMTLGSLSLNGTASSLFELGGTTLGSLYDNVTITSNGTLAYGGNLTVVNFGAYDMTTSGATYDLFAFSGSTSATGNFSNVMVNGVGLINSSGVWTGSGGNASYQFTQSTGDLIISVVPEPGTLALLGASAGLAAFAIVRRRRGR